ncbi:hypothetical protein CHS0354_016735 [Potamilus streckersoni]|uniref:G-protein coupled receptors family 1 profile domain-containing protein n=1 Tax=Potamilus streckersoni TaxID=2493646 RepID=A0AAE0WBV4_9BIVA|nr:hypothetical protein CHS0354_016735 [Potamilus streckersoni]
MTPNDSDIEYGTHDVEDKYVMLYGPSKALCGTGLAILIILAIMGNLLTTIAFILDKSFHSVYDFYIFHLAVTDLLIGTISMPFYAFYTISNLIWPLGRIFCKIYKVVDFTLCFESILIMLILSLDRLLLLAYGPFYTEKETMRKARIKLGISWLISFIIYGPEIILWDFLTGKSDVESTQCEVEFHNNYLYIVITAIIEFLLPFVVLTSMNMIIYFKIRQRGRATNNSLSRRTNSVLNSCQETNLSTVNEKPSTLHVPAAYSSQLVRVNPEQKSKEQWTRGRDVKAARFLSVLVIAFFICWVPYTITTVIKSFCAHCVNENLYQFFQWLLFAKSSINPFLYALNSFRYKRTFLAFFSSVTRRGIRVGPVNSRGTTMADLVF